MQFVYEHANLRHATQIKASAEQLRKQLCLPEAHDAGSWAHPRESQHGRLCSWTDSRNVMKRHWKWDPVPGEVGTLQLDVESDALYFRCLRAHISYPELWATFDEWKGRAAAYLLACRHLFETVVRECEQRTEAPVTIGQDWPLPGVSWGFPRQVYVNATLLAGGCGGLIRLRYDSRQDPDRQDEGVQIWTLWALGEGLAASHDRRQLERWRGVHEILLSGDHFIEDAETVVTLCKTLEDLVRPLKNTLRIEVERGTFDSGRCDLCP